MESGDKRARSRGMMNTAPMTEPAPKLANNRPKFDELRCNSFRPTTGVNAGITEMNRANRKISGQHDLKPGRVASVADYRPERFEKALRWKLYRQGWLFPLPSCHHNQEEAGAI